ncbi:MAG: hypothetical protein R3346_03965 [Candidatus Spechtbacterales bacterium]|nr:hypothetical protein [Candidatus Spechtbacterales bacterium]
MKIKKINIKRIKKDLMNVFKYFPSFFSSHLWSFFTVISFIALVLGLFVFYSNAYGIKDSEYEPFVRIKEVDDKKMDKALDFIEERNDYSLTIPTSNPFTKQ